MTEKNRMTEKGGLKWHYWFREIVLHKSCYYIYTIYRLIRNMDKKARLIMTG